MLKKLQKNISFLLILGFGFSIFPNIVSASVLDDLNEYRTSISQTTSDEVADKITRRYLNYGLTPVNGINGNSGSTINNYFKASNGNIKIVSSSIGFGGNIHGRNTATLSLGGGNTRFLSTFFMSPYNPVPILPTADYTTAIKNPSLVGFYKSPDTIKGGYVNFKITDSSNPDTQTTVYQSGASSYVKNGSYAFWQPYTLTAGTYYWHLQSQNIYNYKTKWVYGGKLTIQVGTPLFTVDSFTNIINTGSIQITGTKLSTVTLNPSISSGSGNVSVSYPTPTTFLLSFTNLSEGGNPFQFIGYDSNTKLTDVYSNIIVVDTQAPKPIGISINGDSVVNGNKYIKSSTGVVSYTATDNSSVYYRTSLDNINWTSWSSFVSSEIYDFGSSEGIKTIYVQYKDGVGNIGEVISDSAYYDKDINPPVVITPNNGDYYTTGDSTITIAGTTDNDTNTLYVNGLPITYSKGSGIFSLKTILNEGDNTLIFQAEDYAGNLSGFKVMTINYDPSLSNLNKGTDTQLQLGNIEANGLFLERVSDDINVPSEVINNVQTEDTSLPRLNN